MNEDLHAKITRLVQEEHQLRARHLDGSGTDTTEVSRMRHLEVQVDQAWDLLRQREARRVAHQDPGEAQERTSSVVENYLS